MTAAKNEGKKSVPAVAPPSVPAADKLTLLSALELENDEQYGDFWLRDGIGTAPEIKGTALDTALFTKCRLNGWDATKCRLTDIRFEQCDMSNESWMQSKLSRVEILGSKLTGFKYIEGILSDVRFDQCNAAVFQLFGSQLKNVMFSNCSLSGADFSSCKMENVVFRNCELQGAIFYDAKMSSVDFRRSGIANIKAHANDLRGAIIDREQMIELAEQLASLLGIHVL